MKTLFISDLHLSPANPELITLAVKFLQGEQAQQADRIYILGDIFNTWLGDDLIPAEFAPFVTQLQKLSQQGKLLYLMVGNRDFMLGKSFADLCGAELLADPTLIELGGKPVLLMHGDSLCIDDVAYQRYRRWVRNRFLQWCFLRLPQRFRQRISDKIKQQSKQQKQYKAAMIMDVNSDAVNQVMQQHQTSLIIHGHTHRPAIHQLAANVYRVVLGDWQQQPSYLICDDHQLTLVDHRVTDSQNQLRLR